MWGELSCSLPVCPLWCPQGRPSAVSRPPLLLSWGSHSYWRGTETLHIYIYTHTVYKQSWHLRRWVCWSICKDSQQSSWADLTLRKRRLARRSLPPCSLIVNRHKQRKCDQTNSMRQNMCLKQVNNQHIKKQKYQDNGLIDYYLKVHLCTFSNISAVKEKPSSTWVRKRSECLGMKLQ